ncbi:MAG: hypothetical protein AcusKO_47050 [Acuticoccus sp.]
MSGPTGPTARSSSAGASRLAGRAFGVAVEGLGIAGTLCVLALAVLIICDVLSRNLANAPLPGVTELVGMAMVAIVFLQLGAAVRAERFTRNTVVIGHLLAKRPRIGHAFEALFSLAGAVTFGLIVAATWKYFATAWSSGQYVGGLSSLFIPVWPSKAIILVGAGAVAIQFAIRAVAALRAALGGTA